MARIAKPRPQKSADVRRNSTDDEDDVEGIYSSMGVLAPTAIDLTDVEFESLGNVDLTEFPQDEVALLSVCIDGANVLWEKAAGAMRKAVVVYKDIVRQCYRKYKGVEVPLSQPATALSP